MKSTLIVTAVAIAALAGSALAQNVQPKNQPDTTSSAPGKPGYSSTGASNQTGSAGSKAMAQGTTHKKKKHHTSRMKSKSNTTTGSGSSSSGSSTGGTSTGTQQK